MATLCGFLSRVLNGAAAVLLFTALVAGLSQNVLADGDSCCCSPLDCTLTRCGICTGGENDCKNSDGKVRGSCASNNYCTICECGPTFFKVCDCT
jgi:hypothetical protein